MASEHPTWGYTRIHRGLKRLGHGVAHTIKAILKDHGIAPPPERGTSTPWKTSLAAHRDGLAAADSFTVEVLTFGGQVRYSVFFVMKLRTRVVEIAGITRHPTEMWMTQLARNLLDAGNGFPCGAQHFILGPGSALLHRLSATAAGQRREATPAAARRQLLLPVAADLIVAAQLPARSPNLNAFAERCVLSVTSECLDHIVPLGEAHLRAAVRAFVAHYHEERPHQGCTRAHRAHVNVDGIRPDPVP